MTPSDWLVSALQRLTMPAEEQIQYLTDKGVAPSADELALEFDDALAGAPLSKRERKLLGPLDAHLNGMSGQHHAALWTISALRTRSEWAEVRRLAREALSAMDLGPD